MSSVRSIVLVASSLTMGLVATWFATNWLKRQGTDSGVSVLVAARDMPAGSKLDRSLIEVRTWPAHHPLNEPIADPALAENRMLNRPVLKGEPILEAKLMPTGERGGLAATLAPGRRAVAVKVNEIIGVAGFALPGTYVDLMVNLQDSPGGAVSKILVERVEVLAVAQDRVVEDSKPRVVNAVTLEVSPQQAEQIDLARNIGTLSLVLRGPLDSQPVSTAGARQADLFRDPSYATRLNGTATKTGLDDRPRQKTSRLVAPVVDKPRTAEVIRGLRRSFE